MLITKMEVNSVITHMVFLLFFVFYWTAILMILYITLHSLIWLMGDKTYSHIVWKNCKNAKIRIEK
jgi:hypothetical protein